MWNGRKRRDTCGSCTCTANCFASNYTWLDNTIVYNNNQGSWAANNPDPLCNCKLCATTSGNQWTNVACCESHDIVCQCRNCLTCEFHCVFLFPYCMNFVLFSYNFVLKNVDNSYQIFIFVINNSNNINHQIINSFFWDKPNPSFCKNAAFNNQGFNIAFFYQSVIKFNSALYVNATTANFYCKFYKHI